MAGTCKRCKGQTTDTRGASPEGLCFGCQHNPCQGVADGCYLEPRECNKKFLHGAPNTADNGYAPQDFIDMMADWMIEHGPDGHCDGHEIIARLAWNFLRDRQ